MGFIFRNPIWPRVRLSSPWNHQRKPSSPPQTNQRKVGNMQTNDIFIITMILGSKYIVSTYTMHIHVCTLA